MADGSLEVRIFFILFEVHSPLVLKSYIFLNLQVVFCKPIHKKCREQKLCFNASRVYIVLFTLSEFFFFLKNFKLYRSV